MRKKIIINGRETNYSVTDDAHIYNDITGKELKGTYKTNEYHSVQLVINGKPKTFMFHRLVAEAFCENPNNYTIVDHIDRNKRNDNASNLRWVTAQQNSLNCERKQKNANKKYCGPFDNSWKPILNHTDYLINKDTCAVINIKTNNIMQQHDRHGYKRVHVDGSLLSLHVLMWETFNNQKVPEGMQIDHIDGDKANNKLENLHLVSHSDNMKNAYANGHKNQIAVRQYSKDGQFLNIYSSYREAAKNINGNESAIRQAVERKGMSGGYYWTLDDDNIDINKIIYDWVPEGYKVIQRFPTYCIDEDGVIYNKRNKRPVPVKFRDDNIPFIIINGHRYNIEDLLHETFNNNE